jgi:hypothetical protein
MPTPIFSDKQKDYSDEYINVRCNVDKRVWYAFKTLVSLKRLDIGKIISDIIRNWVVNFGDVNYKCSNCGMIMGKDSCYIIVKNRAHINCCSMRCFDMVYDRISSK